MFSIKGDTVIDPFVGTGSTIYTAMCSERNSIGVDIDKEYIEHIKSNITEITNTLNDYIEKRIMNHITFVDQYELNKNKLLTKFNKYHDVKVISSQETDIRINMVDNINKINDL
jgi:modification methylase